MENKKTKLTISGNPKKSYKNFEPPKNKGRKITHVGILINENQIIHASGEVRKDGITHEGIIHSKTGEKTHEFSHIRRMEF